MKSRLNLNYSGSEDEGDLSHPEPVLSEGRSTGSDRWMLDANLGYSYDQERD